MSDFLGFDFDNGDECDETTEDDLIYLKDIGTTFKLTVNLLTI